ncbi:MAG TPA: protein kinase [Thermoanaerobaculia bacterium]|jgi:Tol biopolymer transport system component
MPLAAGTMLGPYEIVGPIGAGGMGEVFKARDTRLDRSVAIKVLPSAFAANAQLRIRFEREAKTISQFSHPHICTLYDVGHEGDVAFLVMEYLQGETLAARLTRGPLPVEQVVRYGLQIADALDRAHRQGIVHRDLKPANIMLTASGAKLLDFGLAREFESTSPSDLATEVRGATAKSITEEGTIIGTFQYMAPEQLEGGIADARTDIFALGAVLYEMATARRAFQGRTRASLIASILATEPEPVTAVQPAFPASLDRVVRTCLAKDPDERFQSVHDVKLALQWLTDATVVRGAAPRRSWAGWITAGVLAVALAAATGLLARDWMARRDAKPVRTMIEAPSGGDFLFMSGGGPPEIAPDGTKIVFSAGPPDQPKLWLRALDGTAPQELRGTTGAAFPFWSPDSRSIAFFQNGELKRMQVPAGPIVTICSADSARGGSWSPDGTIIFAMRFSPIYRVAATGGAPVAVTKLTDGDATHRWPRFLPDGRHFVYLASPVGNEDPRNQICAGSIDEPMRKPLVAASSNPLVYDGRLLFTREGNLIAQRLDFDSLTLIGDPVSVPEGQIRTDVQFSRSVVSVAGNGTLVYQTGAYVEESDLCWFDRTGKLLGTVSDRQPYGHIALDPRGTAAAVALRGLERNLWMVDVTRGVRTRLTFDVRSQSPVWSPDGGQLAFGSARQSTQSALELTVMDFATRRERQFRTTPGDKIPGGWSPDGRLLFYTSYGVGSRTGSDLQYVTIADGLSHVYLASPFDDASPRMSPDGRFVAYQSRESGRWQIYIAPFPATGQKWPVSPEGAVVPRWRQDGKELFYAVGDVMTATPIELAATPTIGAPQSLFRFRSAMPLSTAWDVAPDGQRFLINGFATDEPKQQPLTLVQNFDSVLRAAEKQEE